MEEKHSWLPPGLEGSGTDPDDRASSQRSWRKRADRARAKANEPSAEEPEVTRTGDDPKPRKLRGNREWQPIDEPDSERDEGAQREPEKVAVASGGGGEEAEGEQRQPASTGEHRGSETDAMGRDKRREVIGERYGASRARQLLYYGIFVAFLVAVYIGGQAAVSNFDKAPKHDTAQAPWAQRGAPNEPLGGFEPRKADQKGPTRFP